jgi:hypothetical protein
MIRVYLIPLLREMAIQMPRGEEIPLSVLPPDEKIEGEFKEWISFPFIDLFTPSSDLEIHLDIRFSCLCGFWPYIRRRLKTEKKKRIHLIAPRVAPMLSRVLTVVRCLPKRSPVKPRQIQF